jgi:hypothetical protein
MNDPLRHFEIEILPALKDGLLPYNFLDHPYLVNSALNVEYLTLYRPKMAAETV